MARTLTHSHPPTTAQDLRLEVRGMDCGGCVKKVETALGRMPGIESVAASLSSQAVSVRHDGQVSVVEIQRTLRTLGFAVQEPTSAEVPAGTTPPSEPLPRWWQTVTAKLMLATGMSIAAAYAVGAAMPPAQPLLFLAALSIGLLPIARRALVNARYGAVFSIEMLMTIAAMAAVSIGAQEEAAAVVFLFLVGEILETAAANRARSGIRALTALMPRTARRERADGMVEEIAADGVAIGDIIQIRPGDRIPADGVVIAGLGSVDQAPLTGESLPVAKAPGDPVHAGTLNNEALLRVRVTATAADNTIARIVQLVEQAQEAKAPTARFIERFARYYTPFVVVFAALVACVPPLILGEAWSDWVYRAAALLLIGCPCALVISTPAAIASGLSTAARHGLLMKGGAVLEQLGRVQTVAFDKTGTLTIGQPGVTDVIPLSEAVGEAEGLGMAAALSAGSGHPLACAITDTARRQAVTLPPAEALTAVPGQGMAAQIAGDAVFLGSVAAARARSVDRTWLAQAETVSAEGKTVSVLLRGDQPLAVIGFRDVLRSDAVDGVAQLRALGIGAVMVTGDSRAAADAMAGPLGLEARAELLPEDKLAEVRQRQVMGQVVAKVGDGINDAPALAAADVGIAMGGGTEVALETADAASLHGRVGDVAAMVRVSRRTMRVVYQNVGIALGLKAVFLVTTVLGVTGLWPAVLADTGATVLVTANALRLLRARP